MRNRIAAGLLAAALASSAAAHGPDQRERMFPIFAPGALPAGCQIPQEDSRHQPEVTGLIDQATGKSVPDPTKFPALRQMLCSSAVLQYHYARRERRSQKFASVLDGLTLGAAVSAAGLGAAGAPAGAILGAGLLGGGIAVGRNYKAPEARQVLYHKGEAALQCLDRSARAIDPIYADESDPGGARLFGPGGDELDLPGIEAAARVVSGLSGDDPELTSLKAGADQVLLVIKNIRLAQIALMAGYESVAQTIQSRYQDTRAPLDFAKAINLIKQGISAAQGEKADAKVAGAAIAQAAVSNAAKARMAALAATDWRTGLKRQLQDAVRNPKIANAADVRYLFLRMLSAKYDPVRSLASDITVCEAIAET